MNRNARKLTVIQIITIVLIVVYAIWEKNVQAYAASHDTGDALRLDLLFILPVLAIFIGISVWQWFKNKR